MTDASKIAVVGALAAVAGFAVGYYLSPKPIKIAELDNGLKKVCEYSANSLQAAVQAGWPINSFAVWDSDGRAHYHVLNQLGNVKCQFDPELTIVYLRNRGLVEINDLKTLLQNSRKAGDRRLAGYLSAELQTK